MRFKLKAMLLAVVMTAIGTSQSQASFVTYTTQASYLAAISNPGVDTYDDLPLGFVSSPLNRTAGTYTYTASTPNDFFQVGTPPDVWLSTNVSGDTITFNTFSAGVRGVGGFFFSTDNPGNFLPGTSIVLTATDGSGTVNQTLTNTTTGKFFGFVSNGPITFVTVTSVQPANDFAFTTVNDLTLGRAPANAVPAPAGLLLGLTGLPIFGVVARLRRNAVQA